MFLKYLGDWENPTPDVTYVLAICFEKFFDISFLKIVV